ncbi:MAG: ABC transporter substrate-binding protein [Deltaproteobacteria bacterium]|nr:ABC transporter substrate-binding protein [Deltaproteobacteria bacterium]
MTKTETFRRTAFLCLLAVLLLFPGPTPTRSATSNPQKTQVTFITQWVPQAQFAGYYMALDCGLYRQEGLEVTIIHGGPSRASSTWLEKGKADFASFWLVSGIELRNRKIPVVNLAQLVQKSAMMLVARKKDGILEPGDMAGRRVSLWGPPFDFQARLFFKKFKLDIVPVRQSYSINLFLRGAVAVTSAMWYNEYHRIINAGLDPDELVTFRFADYGLNFPEDGIYVMQSFLEAHPETCRAFVRATLAGWEKAFSQPEKALDLTMSRIRKNHIISNRVQQRWMLMRMRDIMQPGTGGIMGRLEADAYRQTVAGLKELKVIEKAPSYEDFHHFSAGGEK